MNDRLVIKALKQNHIPYDILLHSQTFSSTETAQETHTKGKEFAKTIMVKVDDKMMMAVLPANYDLDLRLLTEVMNAKKVSLASEQEFSPMFKDSKIGAMPPMGNLYGMEVIMDNEMKDDNEISFNACNHEEIIRMKFSDYENMVHPMFKNIHS